MKLSVMLFPFYGRLVSGELSTRRLLDVFGEAGVTGLEPMERGIRQNPEFWDDFQRAAENAGFCFPCYDVNVNFVQSGLDTERERAVEHVRKAIDFCVNRLQCPLALLAGTGPAPERAESESRRIYAKGLADALEAVSDKPVTLCIEDYGVYPTFTAGSAHCREVLDAPGCERLGFVFDNGNFLLADERPTAALEAFPGLERIVHVHIKDFALREPDGRPGLTSPSGRPYRGALLGEGEGQVREVLRRLRQAGYDGWLSLEISGAVSDPVEEAIHGLRVMRECWEEA